VEEEVLGMMIWGRCGHKVKVLLQTLEVLVSPDCVSLYLLSPD
jgi:hypothetical protein